MEDEIRREQEPYQNSLNTYAPAQNYSNSDHRRRKGGMSGGAVAALVVACSMAAAAIGGVSGAVGGYVAAKTQASVYEDQTMAEVASMAEQIKALEKANNTITTQTNPAVGTGSALSVEDIASSVLPSVVAITTTVQMQNGGFFGGQMPAQTGGGSGVIISEDGYIMTNNHVVEGASAIEVTLDNGESYDAVVVGYDASTDLAVLKIDATGLDAATLGDSDQLKIGEAVVAIGNPLGELAGTVTNGIISALDRKITIDDKELNVLQTNAAINPGNSGGALVNMRGEVIGINTAKSSGSDVEGIGFAIPMNNAKPIIEELIENGYVTGRPKMGVSLRDVTEDIAQRYNWPVSMYIAAVEEFSAAEKAGLRVGDLIVRVDGIDMTTVEELTEHLKTKKPNDEMTVDIIRDGNNVSLTLTLMEDVPGGIN